MGAPLTFYEFFCGGGLARLGLGRRWRCVFANDLDPIKAQVYRENFGGRHLIEGDVADLSTEALPGRADLAWASFPCQDLSLAGAGGGLGAARSGAFWPFWRLMLGLRAEGRAPRLIVLENVCGLLTSRGGRDFTALVAALEEGGYRAGALVLDARRHVPQSRPRLFLIALDGATPPPAALLKSGTGVVAPGVSDLLPWALPEPPPRAIDLTAIVETEPRPGWDAPDAVARLLALTGPLHREKLAEARAQAAAQGAAVYGAAFRRTRPSGGRLELRFDGVAGCLRTPSGGSSRQRLVRVAPDGDVAMRLFTGREAARLMGVDESYLLPLRPNAALKVMGDAVAPPVVAHLARHLLTPLALSARAAEDAVAAA